MGHVRSDLHSSAAFTLVALLFVVAGGCAGASKNAPAASIPTAARTSAPPAHARISFAIPRALAETAGRKVQFVSPASATLTVDVPPLATQTFVLDSSNCILVANSVTNCTIGVNAPLGSAVFTIGLNDIGGILLATGSSAPVSLTSGAANVVTVPLLGVARKIRIYGDTRPLSGMTSELLQLVGTDNQNQNIYDGIVNPSVVVSSSGSITFTSSSGACPGTNPYTIANPTTLAALLIKECYLGLTTDTVMTTTTAPTLPNAPGSISNYLGIGPIDTPAYHIVVGDTNSGKIYALDAVTGAQTGSLASGNVPANLAYISNGQVVLVGGPNVNYFKVPIDASGSFLGGSGSFAPATAAAAFNVACCTSGGAAAGSTSAGRVETVVVPVPSASPSVSLLYSNAGNTAVAVSPSDSKVYGADATHVTVCAGACGGTPTLSAPRVGANYSSIALYPPIGALPTLLFAGPNPNGGVDQYTLPISSASVPSAQTQTGLIGMATALATSNNTPPNGAVFIADGTSNLIYVFDSALIFRAYHPIDASPDARVMAMVPETQGSRNSKIWFTIGPPVNAVRAMDARSYGILFDYKSVGTPQGIVLAP